MLKRLLAALLTLLLLSLCACNSLESPKITAENLSSDYVRKIKSDNDLPQNAEEKLIDFAFSFYRTAMEKRKTDSSQLCSPLSLILALGMTANGAVGETRAEMEALTGMTVAEMNQALYTIVSRLTADEKKCLKIADSIWFRDEEDLNIRPEFLQTNADWYGAEVFRAPFDNSTVSDINAWVKKNTDGMIEKLLERISSDSVMYLINALAFDCKWSNPYNEYQVRKDTFRASDGQIETVDFLNSTETDYLEGFGFTGFVKAYEGGKFAYVALLPEEGKNIFDAGQALTGAQFRQLWKNRGRDVDVHAKLPVYSYECSYELKEPLMAMGMITPFDRIKADFSEMVDFANGNLYIGSVIQKTFISVGAEGTRAAAVTAVEMKNECAEDQTTRRPEEVYLTRPFLYAIVDTATGMPLFLGSVTSVR